MISIFPFYECLVCVSKEFIVLSAKYVIHIHLQISKQSLIIMDIKDICISNSSWSIQFFPPFPLKNILSFKCSLAPTTGNIIQTGAHTRLCRFTGDWQDISTMKTCTWTTIIDRKRGWRHHRTMILKFVG